MKAKRDVCVEQLRRLPLFVGCADKDLSRIARQADEIAVPPGYVLVHEGDWGDEVFIILDGEADVAAGGETLAVLGPEAVVGERAVIEHSRRSATVTAATPMRLFVLEGASFAELLDEFPLVAERLISDTSHRYRAAQVSPA
jgi:CRP-like cAMP-binding protein